MMKLQQQMPSARRRSKAISFWPNAKSQNSLALSILVQSRLGMLLLLALLVSACGLRQPYSPPSERQLFVQPGRQLAPEPVYSRIRTVHLPEPVPARQVKLVKTALLLPVIHFDVSDVPLEEAALILGATARYRSYCASNVAEKRISLDALGTIDELAAYVAEQAGAHVIVDHQNREVRFLARQHVLPELFEGVSQGLLQEKKVEYNEHQSNN